MNREMTQTEHDRGGYGLGWRFMMSPEQSCATATLGVSPGAANLRGALLSSCKSNVSHHFPSLRGWHFYYPVRPLPQPFLGFFYRTKQQR